VTILVFSIAEQKVKTLLSEDTKAGKHKVILGGTN